MNLRKARLLARLYRRPEPGDDGAGAAPTPAPVEPGGEATAAPAEPAASPAAEPLADAAGAAPADAPAAATLLDAIKSATKGEAAVASPGKPGEPPAPGAADPKPAAKPGEEGAKPGQPAQPPKPDDLTTMPEGLSQKAQERFQQLANSNRELEQRASSAEQARDYFGGQIRENGVSQQQFELATKTVGMINRGDYPGAMRVLQEQMQQLAALSGQSVPAVDALAQHPDLQQLVSNLQISEAHAGEIARARAVQAQTQRQQVAQQQEAQRQQQVQNNQQQELQARQQGLVAVDQLAKQLQTTDLDYPRIEALLLPQAKALFAHLPPSEWAGAFQRQYQLLKSVGGGARPAPAGGPAPGTLRPGAADNPQSQPKNVFEAMWGRARPT